MPEKQITRNAIITAAGMSSRLVPLSFEKPKALTCVRGEILIERIIRQMQEADIYEIVVVVGYFKEQFEYLVDKFGVILVENPYYHLRNTNTSLYLVRDYLKNTIICHSDEYLTENIFLEPSETSYYSLTFMPGHAIDEWCVTMDASGRIIDVNLEGEDCWVATDVAYLIETDSAKMIPLLKETHEDDNAKNLYWEEIWMAHTDEIQMYGRTFENGVVQDLDTLSDFQEFDNNFMDNLNCTVLNKISADLGGTNDRLIDIQNCTPIICDKELTGMHFTVGDEAFKYNHIEQTIDRQTSTEELTLQKLY